MWRRASGRADSTQKEMCRSNLKGAASHRCTEWGWNSRPKQIGLYHQSAWVSEHMVSHPPTLASATALVTPLAEPRAAPSALLVVCHASRSGPAALRALRLGRRRGPQRFASRPDRACHAPCGARAAPSAWCVVRGAARLRQKTRVMSVVSAWA